MVVIRTSTMIIKITLLFLLGTVIVSGSPYKNGKSRPQYKPGRPLLPKRHIPSSAVAVSEIRKSNEDSLSIPVPNAHFGSIRTASRRNLKTIRKPEYASTVKNLRPKYKKNYQRENVQITPLEENKPSTVSLPGTIRFEEPQVLSPVAVVSSSASLTPLEILEVPSLPEKHKLPSLAFPELTKTVKQIRLPGKLASAAYTNDRKTPFRIIKRPILTSPFNKPLPEVEQNLGINNLQDFELSKLPPLESNVNQEIQVLSTTNDVEPCLTLALSEDNIVAVQEFVSPDSPLLLDNIPNVPELQLSTIPEPLSIIILEQPTTPALSYSDIAKQEGFETYMESTPIPEAPELPPLDLSVEAEVKDLQPLDSQNIDNSSTLEKVLAENNLQPLVIPDAPELPSLSLPEPQPEIIEETTLSVPSTEMDQEANLSPTTDCLKSETIPELNFIPEAPELSPLIISEVLVESGEQDSVWTSEAEQSTEEIALLEDVSIPKAPELAPLTENDSPVVEILMSPSFIPEAPKLSLPYLNEITLNEAAEQLIPVSFVNYNEESSHLQKDSISEVNINPELTRYVPKLPPLSLPEPPMKLNIEKESMASNALLESDGNLSEIHLKPKEILSLTPLSLLELSEPQPEIIHQVFTAAESIPENTKNLGLSFESEDPVFPNHLQSVIIPEAPTLSPFVMPKLPPLIISESRIHTKIEDDSDSRPQISQNLYNKDLNELITKTLPPLTLPEAPTELLLKDSIQKSNFETETSQNPTTLKDYKLIIPKAPELLGITKSFAPIDVVVEDPIIPINSYDSGILQSSHNPIACEESDFETEYMPILIPQTPSLSPLVLPPKPLRVVTDKAAKNFNSDEDWTSEINLKPMNIPDAPVLPPFTFSELPEKTDSVEKLAVPLAYDLPAYNSINSELMSETLVFSKIPALPPLELPATPYLLQQPVNVDIEKDSILIGTQKIPTDTELRVLTVPKLPPLSLPAPVPINEGIPSLPDHMSSEISSEVEINNDKLQYNMQIPEAPRLPAMNLPERLVHLSALKKPLEYETKLENLIASDHKQVSYPVLCAQEFVNKHVLPNIVLNRKFQDLKN